MSRLPKALQHAFFALGMLMITLAGAVEQFDQDDAAVAPAAEQCVSVDAAIEIELHS